MRTIRETIAEGTAVLQRSESDSETPFLDALVLLSHTLDISKEKLLASYPDRIEEAYFNSFIDLIAKRSRNYPVSYLIEKKEFYGLPFYVNENVLVPRPDSETLVSNALNIIEIFPDKNSILDLCTGSGALGIALKYTLPNLQVVCSDISPGALEVCRRNSKSILGSDIDTVESNLFDKINGEFDIIITNPPYLTDRETSDMMKKGCKEPSISLKGGRDGLDFIRIIIGKAPGFLKKEGYLLIESSIDQTGRIAEMMASENYCNIRIVEDLSGRNRVTLGQRGLK